MSAETLTYTALGACLKNLASGRSSFAKRLRLPRSLSEQSLVYSNPCPLIPQLDGAIVRQK